jgi:hypothetical protein
VDTVVTIGHELVAIVEAMSPEVSLPDGLRTGIVWLS